MAENKYFGTGGIVVANNFDISVPAPIDSRTTVANETGLQELKNEGRVYEGLVAFNEATKKYHKFINGNWELLIPEIEIINNLTSNSSTEPLAAAQGKILNETKADRTELPSIDSEAEPGKFVIADEAGNIVAQIDGTTDKPYLEMTDVSINGHKITGVDALLSESSTNPIQNKTVAEIIKNLLNDLISFDATNNVLVFSPLASISNEVGDNVGNDY